MTERIPVRVKNDLRAIFAAQGIFKCMDDIFHDGLVEVDTDKMIKWLI